MPWGGHAEHNAAPAVEYLPDEHNWQSVGLPRPLELDEVPAGH